ncbi:MAG: lysophospholipid acyltransferase family protein [Phycisphaerae bacterium]
MKTADTLSPFDLYRPAPGVPRRRWLQAAARVAERVLGLTELTRVHRRIGALAEPPSFAERALRVLNIRWRFDEGAWAHVPRTGPLVVIANHPYGGLDGLLLMALMQRLRPDVRTISNYMLARIPEMHELAFFVDPFGWENSRRRNRPSMRVLLTWLRSGKALAVFPAGGVSYFTFKERCITDPPWPDTIARIVRRSAVPVVPVYFEGHNSLIFQAAGYVHTLLRTVLLPREVVNKRGATMSVRVGSVIPAERVVRFTSDAALSEYLRLRVYVLRGRCAADHEHVASSDLAPDANALPSAKPAEPPRLISAAQQPVAAPSAVAAPRGISASAPAAALAEREAAEIGALPADQCLLTSGPLVVLCARAAQIPNSLQTIGRLREATFRLVGEGTGRDVDLDRFDEHYWQLFLWNRDERRIVGGYRLGASDEILPRFGVEGFYTRTLFQFGRELIEQIGPTLEMGRSFVVPEYQRSYSSLLLLWKGIARFIVAHPRYRTFFGAVSISNEYQSMTKQLLMAFLQANRLKHELAPLLRPLNPPRLAPLRPDERRLVSRVVRDIDDVDELVHEIESRHKHVPVLLRQYLRLNARLLGFNVDPEFGNVLDGLVLVDLLQIDPVVFERYCTPEGAARYRAHHAATSNRESLAAQHD